jgi:hypothetical protein
MDRKFDKIDGRLERIDGRFERMEDRIDSMQRTTVHGVIAISGAMVAGFAGVMGLLATQL